MDKTEALRSIHYDLLEYIQRKVRVDFDYARQRPVSFTVGGKKHVVGEVVGRFRTRREYPVNAFLVRENSDDVFFLYFNYSGFDPHGSLATGNWVLSFRILNDNELMAFYREDRKMLINMTLKRVVDFHGHLCPDLAIGGKVCEYVQKLFSTGSESDGGISIIAENSTSALDAIQVLLGVSVGNQRLQIMDFGKHNYMIFFRNIGEGCKLSLQRQQYGDEDEYNRIESRILNNEATFDEITQFQSFLDGRVKHLLGLPPERLFKVEPCHEKPALYHTESASVYLTCTCCGEQVLKSHVIDYQGRVCCIPCFQRLNNGDACRRLQ
ncbi:MAG: hypothetical protein GXP57_02475 [Deltaproteobacteria bacterium]|nr:hypothetical protein [Deltaproteobacteria bacterium]